MRNWIYESIKQAAHTYAKYLRTGEDYYYEEFLAQTSLIRATICDKVLYGNSANYYDKIHQDIIARGTHIYNKYYQ